MIDLYTLAAYQYELPEELIAQRPAMPRDSSKLMIIERQTGNISIVNFRDLLDLLKKGDRLIFNDTRVIPARLTGTRKQGGKSEIFLIKCRPDGTWNALVRPGKRLKIGAIVQFEPGFCAEIVAIEPNGERVVRFQCVTDLHQVLEKHGQIPLPPYIRRPADQADRERYQTVYAARAGALAAPTAGLHFTEELLHKITAKGVEKINITLHTGLGTFVPVKTEDIRSHAMHAEQATILPCAAEKLNRLQSAGLNICVGTTCCRTLESAATAEGAIIPGAYDTKIFIYPGYQFKYVKQLLTNFHLPGSTLLMLVSAFAGHELIRKAYQIAIKERLRFFSYGDAMLIL